MEGWREGGREGGRDGGMEGGREGGREVVFKKTRDMLCIQFQFQKDK